jgi:hypothetical protein
MMWYPFAFEQVTSADSPSKKSPQPPFIAILESSVGIESHCWTSRQWHPLINPCLFLRNAIAKGGCIDCPPFIKGGQGGF